MTLLSSSGVVRPPFDGSPLRDTNFEPCLSSEVPSNILLKVNPMAGVLLDALLNPCAAETPALDLASHYNGRLGRRHGQ